jgi:hypothetical protein
VNAFVRSERAVRTVGRSVLNDAEGTACCCGPPGVLRVVDPCIGFLPDRCIEPPPGTSPGDIIFYREVGGIYRCGTLTETPCGFPDSNAVASGFADCGECESLPCVDECDLICTNDPAAILLGTFTASGTWTYVYSTSGGACAFDVEETFVLSMSTMYVPGSDALSCKYVRMPGSATSECTPLFLFDCPDVNGTVFVTAETFTPPWLEYDCSAGAWRGVTPQGGRPLKVQIQSPGLVPGGPPADPCQFGAGFVNVFRETRPTLASGLEPCAVGSYAEALTNDRLVSTQPFATMTLSISSFTFDVVRIV